MLSFPKNIDSFLLRSSLGPYIKRDNPTAFAMGFSYLSAAEFIRCPSTLGTPEGQLEQPQATGTIWNYLERPSAYWNRASGSPWNGPPLTRGVREGLCFGRVRLCFSRVVRLLQRAEESCEGLKHGYYNLPCVHFLIFLCHDIKNKIDRLLF